MTAEAFLALPETNLPTELIDGEMIMSPAPNLDHQDVVGDTNDVVRRLAKPKGGKVYFAPTDVKFDDKNIVQPDIFWVAPDSKCKPVGRKHFEGAPDLIVEILSPGTARRDKRTKFALYEKHGVREYWIVSAADKYVEVWQLNEAGKFGLFGTFGPGETFESPLLGAVNMDEIFAAPQEKAADPQDQ
jgi:Uma2 family endonuclease